MEICRKAGASTYQALTLPARWFSQYDDFIVKNSSAVSQIETALRSLTYIIPGRFRDAEIASESLHSSVQLLSLYHDSLLTDALAGLRPSARKPLPSPHARYTRHMTRASPLYRRLALVVQMLVHTQLLWEMLAKRHDVKRSSKSGQPTVGGKMRWRVVVTLEVIKAVCRLVLLRLARGRMHVSPALPEREVDPALLEEEKERQRRRQQQQKSPSPPLTSDEELLAQIDDDSQQGFFGSINHQQQQQYKNTSWTMPRTGLTFPALPNPASLPHFLVSRVAQADDIRPAMRLLNRLGSGGELAEMLHIVRPVVYALALQYWQSKRSKGKNSNALSLWKPWLLGLSIEYGARQLAKREFRNSVAGGLRGLTGLERAEMQKRAVNLGWWVMRGAFYENITGPWIRSLAGRLKSKPLLDMVGGIVDDYDFLWNEYYFATSTL